MKPILALSLVIAAFPVLPAIAGRPATDASSHRRVCTQISVRAGSRMSGRRICRTATEWREALGPDWRMHLAGSTGTQDDYDSMAARTSPEGDTGGVRGVRGGGLVSRAAGPN